MVRKSPDKQWNGQNSILFHETFPLKDHCFPSHKIFSFNYDMCRWMADKCDDTGSGHLWGCSIHVDKTLNLTNIFRRKFYLFIHIHVIFHFTEQHINSTAYGNVCKI
jgi:hypothetical protein